MLVMRTSRPSRTRDQSRDGNRAGHTAPDLGPLGRWRFWACLCVTGVPLAVPRLMRSAALHVQRHIPLPSGTGSFSKPNSDQAPLPRLAQGPLNPAGLSMRLLGEHPVPAGRRCRMFVGRVPVQDRDKELFAAFVSARYSSLYRTAYLLTGNHHTAEDVVQAALIKVYVSWRRVRAADRPESYARRVVVNEVVSLRRRRWTHDVMSDRPGELAEAGSNPGPEQAVVDTHAVWEALATLTPRQRAVLVLRYYEDMSEAEIAAILDIAPGTVKAHAHAALVALRAKVPVDAGASTNKRDWS